MRGQTTLDFAVGVSLFLVTVAFVFSFTPTLVAPFTADDGALALTADRSATQLVSDELGDADTPYVLDDEAVSTFFSKAQGNQTYVRERLGLDSSVGINVTLTTDTGGCPGSLSICRLGPAPPNGESVVTAWRITWVADDRADLQVRVW